MAEEKRPLVLVEPPSTPGKSSLSSYQAPTYNINPGITMMLLGISTFFMTATVAISGSILTLVKKKYFGGDSEASLINAYFESAASLIGMAILPVFGSISDSVGRRPFLWLLGFGSMIPYTTLYFLPGNMYLLLITNSVVGCVCGLSSYPIISAVIADVATGSNRGWFMSVIMACAAVGLFTSLTGPVLGLNHQQTFMVCAGCSILGGIPLLFLRETLAQEYRKKFKWKYVENPVTALRALKHPGLRFCSLVAFCAGLPEQGIMNTIMFYLNDKFDFSSMQFSVLFAEIGLLMLITSTVVFRILLHYCTERQIVLIGLTANAIHLLAYAVAWNPYIIYGVASPMAALSFVTYPALTSIASQQHAPKNQGKVMGVMGSIKGLTTVFGPLMFGVLYQVCKGPPVYFPQLPLYIGAAMVFAVLAVAVFKLDDAPSTPIMDDDDQEDQKPKTVQDA